MLQLHIVNDEFVDQDGNSVILHGMNVAADMKFPIDGSFINSFPLAEADQHFARIRLLGFNTIRMIFTWDALEPEGPGKYDYEYIAYMVELIKKCKVHGFYVFMDPHQDVWSRFSAGSGAPLWTFHAAGINPDNFEVTGAAVFGEKHPDIKMIWASNYHRLACQVMFTAFFAGNDFLPLLKINNQTIQDYLEGCYLNAVKELAQAVAKEDPNLVIGWESLNEPGHGLVGYFNLGQLPSEQQHVKLGASPTPFQAMVLGKGHKQVVENYIFTSMGIKKNGSQLIDPKGEPLWYPPEPLEAIDAKYGWERSWPGGCIFELHGIYNCPQHGSPKLLDPLYFTKNRHNNKPVDETTFVDKYFVNHYIRYKNTIREVHDDWFLFIQPPVNCEPPNIADKHCDVHDFIDDKTVYSPHYYDGLTLMLKQWRFFNVDALGVIRNKYSNPPIMALRVGGQAIRQSLKQQLSYLKKEGQEFLCRNLPVVITEIGIPFDIDPSCHIRAMDANCYALERSNIHHTLWVYTRTNTLKGGDNWNGEDLSIYCTDLHKKAANPSDLHAGVRAIEALARPYPINATGKFVDYGFDVKTGIFSCKIKFSPDNDSPRATFVLPEYYFPKARSNAAISTSSGKWTVEANTLTWIPAGPGTHAIQVKTAPKYVHPPCAIS